MGIRSTALALGLASVVAGCATAPAQKPTKLALSDCSSLSSDQSATALYGAGKVKKVEPRYRQEFLARAIQPRYVAGANVYIPAEPGMSSAYLERVLRCHAASTSSASPNDPLRVKGISDIVVSTAGPAMRIAIIGVDRTAGKDIWQRAVALNEQHGDVSVEQL